MTDHTARADQIAAELRDARCCDALEPCDDCKGGRVEVAVRRHLDRVAGVACGAQFARVAR